MHTQQKQKQQQLDKPLTDTQSQRIVTSLGIYSNSTLERKPRQNPSIQPKAQYLCSEYNKVGSPKIGNHQYSQKIGTNECKYGRQSKDHDGDISNIINSVKSIEERIREVNKANKIGQGCQKQNGDISVENAEDPNLNGKNKKVDGSRIQSESSIRKEVGWAGKNVDGRQEEGGWQIREWQREYSILHNKLRSSLQYEQTQIKQMLRLLKQIQIDNTLKDTKCQISQVESQIRKIKLYLADGFKESSQIRNVVKPLKCNRKRVSQLRYYIQNQKKLSNYLSIHELELEEVENKLKYQAAKVKQQRERREQQGWISEEASQQSSKATVIEIAQAAALATTQIDPNIVNKICESKLYINDLIKLTDNSESSSKFLFIKDSAPFREYDHDHDHRHGHYDSDYAYHFASTNVVTNNNNNNHNNIANNGQVDSNINMIGQNEGGSQFSSISDILNSSAFAVKNVFYQSSSQTVNQLQQMSDGIKQIQAKNGKNNVNGRSSKEYYKLLEQRRVILQRSIIQSKEEQKKKEQLLKQQRMSIKKCIEYFKLQTFLLQSQSRRLCYTQLRHNSFKRQHLMNQFSFNSFRFLQKKDRQKSESRKIRAYKIKTDYSSHQNQNSNSKQHSYGYKMAVDQYQYANSGHEGIQAPNQAIGRYSRNLNQFGYGSEVGRKCGVRSFKFRSSFKSNKGSRDSSPRDFIPDSEQSNIYGFKSSRAQKSHTLVVSETKKRIKYPSTLSKNRDEHSKTQKQLQKSKEQKQKQQQIRGKERCSTRHEQKIEQRQRQRQRQRYGNPNKILRNSQYSCRSGSSILNNGVDGNQMLKGIRYKDGSGSKGGQLGRFRQEYYAMPQ